MSNDNLTQPPLIRYFKRVVNRISNRLRVINNEIELSDLNKSYNAFKMLMKKLYLSGTPIT